MARLISYKVKDDSEYSTFIDKRDTTKSFEEIQRNNQKEWWRNLYCCDYCCNKNIAEYQEDSEQVEFALIKETKVRYAIVEIPVTVLFSGLSFISVVEIQ